MSKYLSILVVALLCVAGVANAALIHQYDPAANKWDDQQGTLNMTPENGASIVSAGTTSTTLTKAFKFDGVDDYAQSIAVGFQDAVTFELWVKFDAMTDDDDALQVIYETGRSRGLSFYLAKDGTLTFRHGKKADDGIAVSYNLTNLAATAQSEFIQIVGVTERANEKTRLYVNGSLVDSFDGQTTNDWGGNDDAGLGYDNGGGGNNVGSWSEDLPPEGEWEAFDGQVGLVNVYDNAMTDTEVADAYAAIPEPATMSLLAIGGLGVLIRRRK